MRRYYLAAYRDRDGYWTRFADFDCLYDQGDTLEEAIARSRAMLESYAETEPLPEPSRLAEFFKKLDPADGAPAIFPIELPERETEDAGAGRIP